MARKIKTDNTITTISKSVDSKVHKYRIISQKKDYENLEYNVLVDDSRLLFSEWFDYICLVEKQFNNIKERVDYIYSERFSHDNIIETEHDVFFRVYNNIIQDSSWLYNYINTKGEFILDKWIDGGDDFINDESYEVENPSDFYIVINRWSENMGVYQSNIMNYKGEILPIWREETFFNNVSDNYNFSHVTDKEFISKLKFIKG